MELSQYMQIGHLFSSLCITKDRHKTLFKASMDVF